MLPELIKVRQKFNGDCLKDIEGVIVSEIDKLNLSIPKGARIAITAGSRGIHCIPLIIRTVVQKVKALGGEPFIVPAMGSHGGATAEGQEKVLKELGITPGDMGAAILSSMDVVGIGEISGGIKACMDRNAYQADGIIVVNRVKPHTSFHGEIESGMMKMMAVGLGKAVQAANIHSFGTRGLREYIVPLGRQALATGKVLAGIGIVENAYDRVMDIRAFLPRDIENGDKELLVKARGCMPRLPVDDLDVLIVEQIGKNISGTGMDTNIIGRLKIDGEPEPERPRIKKIVALDLAPETNGNALGIGLADFTVRALVDKIDYEATYANVITTTFTERGKIPIIARDEEEAAALAMKTCGLSDGSEARIIRIRNTLALEEIWVSRSVYEEIKDVVSVE